ncbi:LLM class flavin-dependent oxidoreductase [Nonomuraea sp. NPDC049709]|uniref:LLM class flavin-dependent oxidoreductase n=1 Tax=Nonomuraea sp. NPDC049709 TaxID=3154736 RepID=UPI003429D734
MGLFEIGVILPGVAVQRRDGLTLQEAARHAEDAGLDGIWHGDHLAVGGPTLDAPIALATAAAVTSRIRIGTSVFIPAIRPLAWAAKQIATLVYVSGDRLVLGVGSGGGAGQWAAAGVPYGERGRRTDLALELLPRLLAGDPVTLPTDHTPPPPDQPPAPDHATPAPGRPRLPSEPGHQQQPGLPSAAGQPQEPGLPSAGRRSQEPRLPSAAGRSQGPGPASAAGQPQEPGGAGASVQLAPAVAMPQVWVGNASAAAIRRAARLGDGWFPSLISPREVASGRARLAELAAGHDRPAPLIAIGGTAALGTGPGLPSREETASGIATGYGRPLQDVIDLPLTGHPKAAAERLAEYREAGATHAVIGVSGGDWRAQVDLLAEVRSLLS